MQLYEINKTIFTKERVYMDWINTIKRYIPYNEQEKKDKEIILKYVEHFDDVLTRDNEVAHITSSGFIVNKERNKVLMAHHNIYNSWAWTGGHADGEEDLLHVALEEAKEETGVANPRPAIIDIFSLDILPVLGHIKRGEYVSAHLHLSVAYLLEADEDEILKVKKDENSGVKWIPINEINEYTNEPYIQKVYGKLITKMRELDK